VLFGKPTVEQQWSKVVKLMREGERHRPRHDRPNSLRNGEYDSLIMESHEVIFDHFNWFGPALNQQVSEPWAVEEVADTLVRDIRSDSPEFGRRYRVWYNAAEMGTVQITVSGMDSFFHPEKYRENPEAEAIVDLSWMRFVPYLDAQSFVSGLALLMGDWVDYDTSHAAAEAAATAALAEYLWETMRSEDEYVPDFDWRVKGPFKVLRLTTDHWAEGGIDPFVAWNGDRPSAVSEE